MSDKMSDKTYNLLFIGETGSGKSTFINSFANIVAYKTLVEARNSQLITLIGTHYVYENGESETETISGIDDTGEQHDVGESATKYCKQHFFAYDESQLICIIDTPGTGDTGGPERDKSNMSNIVTFINTKKNLNAICVVMKASNNKLTEHFEHCLTILLNQLHKSALKNLIFIFTHCKGVNFSAAQPMSILRKFFSKSKSINPNMEFELSKDKVFCVENEVYNHLLSLQKKKGIVEADYNESWNKTRAEVFRMLSYMFELQPHNAQETVSLHKTRHLLENIIEPIVDVIEMNEVNSLAIESHRKVLENAENNLERIKNLMNTPILNLSTVKLSNPKMVCKSEKCRSKIITDESSHVMFPQTCCENCREIAHWWSGHPYLKFTPECNKCGCSADDHHRIYHETKIVHLRNADFELSSKLTSFESATLAIKELIDKLKTDCDTYNNEKIEITKTVAKFSLFLKRNALLSYKDIFEVKMNEKLADLRCNQNTSQRLQSLENVLHHYNREQRTLSESKYNPDDQDVTKLIKNLCSMTSYGPAIKSRYSIIEEMFDVENIDKNTPVNRVNGFVIDKVRNKDYSIDEETLYTRFTKYFKFN